MGFSITKKKSREETGPLALSAEPNRNVTGRSAGSA